jgi:anti-sigma B factor antagonist
MNKGKGPMVLNVSLDGDVAILSNFGGLLNDPRHFEASGDVRALLDQGFRKFVLEMANIREIGETALGLLMTITRQIRQADGEIVLAKPGKGVVEFLTEMQMEDYWDIEETVASAMESLRRGRD